MNEFDAIRSLARNIVNQIGDLYSEHIPSDDWVRVRQDTNDDLDEFVSWLLTLLARMAWSEGNYAGWRDSSCGVPEPEIAVNPYHEEALK